MEGYLFSCPLASTLKAASTASLIAAAVATYASAVETPSSARKRSISWRIPMT